MSTNLSLENFPEVGVGIGRGRNTDGRAVDSVHRDLRGAHLHSDAGAETRVARGVEGHVDRGLEWCVDAVPEALDAHPGGGVLSDKLHQAASDPARVKKKHRKVDLELR